jgi:hypothetical protein
MAKRKKYEFEELFQGEFGEISLDARDVDGEKSEYPYSDFLKYSTEIGHLIFSFGFRRHKSHNNVFKATVAFYDYEDQDVGGYFTNDITYIVKIKPSVANKGLLILPEQIFWKQSSPKTRRDFDVHYRLKDDQVIERLYDNNGVKQQRVLTLDEYRRDNALVINAIESSPVIRGLLIEAGYDIELKPETKRTR